MVYLTAKPAGTKANSTLTQEPIKIYLSWPDMLNFGSGVDFLKKDLDLLGLPDSTWSNVAVEDVEPLQVFL